MISVVLIIELYCVSNVCCHDVVSQSLPEEVAFYHGLVVLCYACCIDRNVVYENTLSIIVSLVYFVVHVDYVMLQCLVFLITSL